MGKKKSATEPTQPFELLTSSEFLQRAEKVSGKDPGRKWFTEAVKSFLRDGSSPEALYALWQEAITTAGLSGMGTGDTKDAFDRGREEGCQEGKKIGFKEGKEAAATNLESAVNGGWNKGWTEGYRRGSEGGAKQGFDEGRAEGYREGKKEGYEKGHIAGVQLGRKQSREEQKRVMADASVDTTDLPIPMPASLTPHHVSVSVSTESQQTLADARVFTDSIETPSPPPPLPTPHDIMQPDMTSQDPKSSQGEVNLEAPQRLDWSEDDEYIPPVPLFTAAPKHRDFSALRSNTRRPFSSLQNRAQRSHHWSFTPKHHSHSSTHTATRPLHYQKPFDNRPHYRPFRSFQGQRMNPRLSPLDWNGDPHLRELGRILGELGWVRS
ncbi:hypothetical protein VKT23_000304 [Stygiomarasmius scandens]|uniref:Essential protein Yae1 N-terminal domain-containing protein n=1 Tax=Marasmiellus scandens TaxID=2682957 RepID=A0ABR1K4Q8_9AGAR